MTKKRDYKHEYQLKLARGENLRTKLIGVRLQNDIFDDFTKAAEKNGLTRTEVLRLFIDDYIKKKQGLKIPCFLGNPLTGYRVFS